MDAACPVALETPWRNSLKHKSIQHSRIRPVEIRNGRFPSQEEEFGSFIRKEKSHILYGCRLLLLDMGLKKFWRRGTKKA